MVADPASEPPLFDQLAIIGLGLIGSSLCHAARRHGLARQLIGYSASAATREIALSLGLVDRIADSAASAAAGADCVVLATPVGAFAPLAAEIGEALQPGAIVTDVGSVKRAPIKMITPCLPMGVHFVPGHPIAGTEESGPRAGFAELFEGRWCILTPVEATDPAATERIAALWRRCGMRIDFMSAEHHDLILAVISHVPHLISYNIVGTAHDLEFVTDSEIIKFSASGFRDFTRLSASDPIMWRDVFLHNRDIILEVLARFVEDLTALQRSIRWGEDEVLLNKLVQARLIRRNIVESGQDIVVSALDRAGRKGSAS